MYSLMVLVGPVLLIMTSMAACLLTVTSDKEVKTAIRKYAEGNKLVRSLSYLTNPKVVLPLLILDFFYILVKPFILTW
uniref:Uncharacterized protein n=1 Tax=Podoviridae sp. ctz6O13 TaxID=2827757 RepID=A0A8S5TKS0_9CAUD|nr:MAG TPA: hypothetical protein [Podoviridae sp. ctz6O13]